MSQKIKKADRHLCETDPYLLMNLRYMSSLHHNQSSVNPHLLVNALVSS